MVILVLALVLMSGAVFLVLERLSVSQRLVHAQLKRANVSAPSSMRDRELQKGARERLLAPLMHRFAALAMRASPAGKRVEMARKLQQAGISASPQKLLAFKGLFSVLGLFVAIVGTIATGAIAVTLIGGTLFVIGFLGPDFFLSSRIRKRRGAMERMLPDTLDLLTVSVEAGLGFDAAVNKVVEKMDGPLIEEFALMAREIRVGETRREALRNLGERVESDDIRTFARAIVQAEELGSSLGRTLKVQAQDMRIHRQLSAEEKAMKAPVKMLFPTVLFIFPAMFIVIIGPAFLNILASFAGAGV